MIFYLMFVASNNKIVKLGGWVWKQNEIDAVPKRKHSKTSLQDYKSCLSSKKDGLCDMCRIYFIAETVNLTVFFS